MTFTGFFSRLSAALLRLAARRGIRIDERHRGGRRRGYARDGAGIGMRRVREHRLFGLPHRTPRESTNAIARMTSMVHLASRCEPSRSRSPAAPKSSPLVERPAPEPSRGEVRVRVRATAVNRADLLQRMGAYPAPADAPPDIPGLEIAGEVDALGPGVERLAIGDRVFGLVGGGGYAEAVVSHERALAKIPDGMSFEDAAAVPEAFVTAHDAIVAQAELRSGEVAARPRGRQRRRHGGGPARPRARRVRRSAPRARRTSSIARASSAWTSASCRTTGKFADAVQARRAGAAVVLELVGGAYLAEDLRCVAAARPDRARRPARRRARPSSTSALVLRKRVRILGTVLRARPLEEKIAAMRAFEAQVVPLLARGVVQADRRSRDAARRRRARRTSAWRATQGFGKIVLRC